MELVAAVGLVREREFLYFLDGNAIWRQPMRRPGTKTPERELVWRGEFVRDPAYFYFVDPAGNVARILLPKAPPGSRTAPPRPRRERRALPLAASDRAHVIASLPPELASLVGESAQDRLASRGRWSALVDPQLRALAAWIVDAIPRAVYLGEQPLVELEKHEHRFSLAAPIPRDEVVQRLRAAGVRDEPTMIEFFATFGESDDFTLPSRDLPAVFLAPNGDRVLLDPATGHFNWANRERARLEPAGDSFAELLRRYLYVIKDGGSFDAFSAERVPPAP